MSCGQRTRRPKATRRSLRRNSTSSGIESIGSGCVSLPSKFMDPAVAKLIARLHATELRLALVLSGGGTTASGWLLAVPGGSKSILEIAVPYGAEVLADYLG